ESKPQLNRYTDADLAGIVAAPEPVEKLSSDPEKLDIPEDSQQRMQLIMRLPESIVDKLYDHWDELLVKRSRFLNEEGVVAVLVDDDRARDGLVFSESAGSHEAKDPLAPPTFVLTGENYNRIARLVKRETPVRIQVNLLAKASAQAV